MELAEVRKVWYPPASAGYRDYEPPRDPEARQQREIARLEADEAEVHRTGWALITIKRVYRDTLIRHYRDGEQIGRHARGAALSAFASAWVIWSDVVDGPLNPY